MELTIGSIYDGTVKTITNFGAFVQFGAQQVGMVHISEISFTYVNDIHDVLKEGQAVKVKLLSIDDRGKIALSIKRAQTRPAPAPAAPRQEQRQAPLSFEEKLKQFMSDSDSKISGSRQYEHRTRSRKR